MALQSWFANTTVSWCYVTFPHYALFVCVCTGLIRGSEGSGSGGPQDRGGGQTQGLHPVGLQICPFHCPSLLLPVSLHVPIPQAT